MTDRAIAQWMLDQLRRETVLYQDVVVTQIASQFGDEFTYVNENGNLAIDRRVLREFRKISDALLSGNAENGCGVSGKITTNPVEAKTKSLRTAPEQIVGRERRGRELQG